MYYISIVITILANVIYNISQKSINESINPFISLIVTYAVAIIASILGLILIPSDTTISSSLKGLNWASYLVGTSAFGLELGFLYVYRSGWNVSIAPIVISVLSTIALIIISIFLYKTKINLTNSLGILLAIVSLILINKK
jgi:multidrug transporter EmrE-like cation transporter